MAEIKEFFKGLVGKTQDKITDLVDKNITNEEKKEVLDTTIKNWATEKLKSVSINAIAKWLIQKYLIGNIGIFTQLVFDLLKASVDNLTRKAV